MSVKRNDRRDKRRDEAIQRQSLTNQMSVSERIAALDARLGTGVGAVKERARLEESCKTQS